MDETEAVKQTVEHVEGNNNLPAPWQAPVPTNVTPEQIVALQERPADIQGVLQRVEAMNEIVGKLLKPKIDFMTIQGNKFLLKQGVEAIAMAFRLAPRYERVWTDLDNGHIECESICHIYHQSTGMYVGEGAATCGTLEARFYVWVDSRNQSKGKKPKWVKSPRECKHEVEQMADTRAFRSAVRRVTPAGRVFGDDPEIIQDYIDRGVMGDKAGSDGKTTKAASENYVKALQKLYDDMPKAKDKPLPSFYETRSLAELARHYLDGRDDIETITDIQNTRECGILIDRFGKRKTRLVRANEIVTLYRHLYESAEAAVERGDIPKGAPSIMDFVSTVVGKKVTDIMALSGPKMADVIKSIKARQKLVDAKIAKNGSTE